MTDDLYPPLPAEVAAERFAELRRVLAATPRPEPIADHKSAGRPRRESPQPAPASGLDANTEPGFSGEVA